MSSEIITSTANGRIKQTRKLADRKERAKENIFFAEGLRIVIEAIQLNAEISLLILAPELLRSEVGLEKIDGFVQQHPDKILNVSAEVFRSLSTKDGPQGIAAVIKQKWSNLGEQIPSKTGCWIALDEVADPGNLGTIIRTADAVGAEGIILLDSCTDPYDPAALRGSMGAVFSVNLIKAQFELFVAWAKKNQIQILGTSDRSAVNYHQANYPQPVILLMGSERQGLDEKHFEVCDQVVAIPMNGRSDSLNLAVATGICLYEIYNQWQDNNSNRSGK